MKKRIVMPLFILFCIAHSIINAGFFENRAQALKNAQKACLANKAQCLGNVWNIISKMISEKRYHFDEKPEVYVIYEGTVYNFTDQNVNQPIGGRDLNSNLPIHYAAEVGDVGDLKTLLAWGANINSKNRFDETPLLKAAQGGNFHAVNFLLKNGAQITTSRSPFEDFNPFHYAVLLPKRTNENTDIVLKVLQALVNHDKNSLYLNKTSRLGTPLEIAVKEQLNPQIINFLILQGAQITNNVKKAIHKLGPQYADIKKKIKEKTAYTQIR